MRSRDEHLLRVALALALLSVALGVLAARFATWPGDRALADAARALGDPFAAVATATNDAHAVASAFALGLAAAVAAARRRGDAVIVLMLALAGRLALNVPRDLIDRPRPAGDVAPGMLASGPSFPSGHVLTATLALGLWFALAPGLVPARWVPAVRVAAVVGVTVTAFARVWSGAHWPSDTLGAVVWMGAVLALAVALQPPLQGALRAAVRRAR